MSEKSDSQDRPPILGTWKKLYLFVFGQLVVLIILFYLFTKYYS
jgi:hypothetical protein